LVGIIVTVIFIGIVFFAFGEFVDFEVFIIVAIILVVFLFFKVRFDEGLHAHEHIPVAILTPGVGIGRAIGGRTQTDQHGGVFVLAVFRNDRFG
jgi:hypothetical protein